MQNYGNIGSNVPIQIIIEGDAEVPAVATGTQTYLYFVGRTSDSPNNTYTCAITPKNSVARAQLTVQKYYAIDCTKVTITQQIGDDKFEKRNYDADYMIQAIITTNTSVRTTS